ncbi:SusC/RagA family TonB-linked outer membrane protein [Flavobacterium koreense]
MKTIYKKLLFLLLMLPLSVLAQTTVEGVVVDSKSNQPIPGVNVIVQGTQVGTSTDFDGKFKLAKIKKGDKLVFSFIGYKNETVTFDGQKSITVSMTEEANVLQEVVVQVGYGAVKKKDATGAVEVLTTKEMNKGYVSTVEGLLNGRAAGVVVTQGGSPGAGAAIRIRGESSLYAKNDPLVVVDGVPIENGINSINPNDIETISVLKDASSTAIYGNRASAGVILITTKKGAKGDLRVSVNTTLTVNTLAKKLETTSAADFRAFMTNPANIAQYNIDPARIAKMGTASTNWQDEIFSNSVTLDNFVSMRGALLGKLPASFSYGHSYIPGILETSKYDRTTTALRLNPSFLKDHLKFAVNGNFTVTKNRYADEGAIKDAVTFDPTQHVMNGNPLNGGYFEWYDNSGNPNFQATDNPVAKLHQTNNIDKSYRYLGSIQADYKFHFLPELKLSGIASIDRTTGEKSYYLSNQSIGGLYNGTVNLGNSSNGWWVNSQKSLEVYLNYAKKFGKINVDVTAGHSFQSTRKENFNSGNLNDPTNVINSFDYFLNPVINMESYFGRANLGFDSKYLLTLNLRRDSSNRFDLSNNTEIFPGAAFAWVVSNEGFLKNSNSLTSLKLRAGWGQTGQQDLGYDYFPYLPSYLSSNIGSFYNFGNTTYQPVSALFYSALLKWETVTSTNFGVDFELFKKVKGSLDLYQKETEELLAKDVPYPDGANLSNNGPRNFGNLRIRGVEFNLNSDIVKSDNFNWNLNFNTNYQKREITATALDGTDAAGIAWGDFAGGVGNKIQIQSTGHAPSSFYVYEQVYGTDGKPLEGVFVDRNNDGLVNSKDMYHYKKPYADFTFGLMSNMTYKKWDFSMAWRASLGNYNYNNTDSSLGYLQKSTSQLTPLNNINPSFFDTGFVYEGNNRYFSDYYIQDASFVKLDNVSVGYSFNEPFGKSTSAKLSFGVQNALTITKYKGIDPEIFGGIDNTIYPRARMYVIGCNVNF